jgi:hypothetical protein
MVPLVRSFAKAKLVKESLRRTSILVKRLLLQLHDFLRHLFNLKLFEVFASFVIFAIVKHLDYTSYLFLFNLALFDELSICLHLVFFVGRKFFVDEEV